jgi:hypothetical protein
MISTFLFDELSDQLPKCPADKMTMYWYGEKTHLLYGFIY